jgi:hypothetical protein
MALFSLIRHRSLDVLSIMVLLSTGSGIISALLAGGNESLILMSGSLFTGTLGIACFVSLLLPKPLMFYLARQFTTGRDPVKRARFNEGWQKPQARSVHRLITIVWGCAFLGDFFIRLVLVLTLPHALVIALAPFVLVGTNGLAMLWTLAYGRSLAQRGKQGQHTVQ